MSLRLEPVHRTAMESSHLLEAEEGGSRRVREGLAWVYGEHPALVAESEARLARLAALHRQHYGTGCQFIRTPGRINLIGEHTDYNGLPVLPMTLQRDLLLAFSPRSDGRVRIRNVSDEYAPREFAVEPAIAPTPGDWVNYVKAAWQALAGLLAEKGVSLDRLGGADLLLDGNLPSGAGLSSSSALVVASALAGLHAANLPVDKHDLAERLAEGERYVGTCGGGMDQAVVLLGEPGHALLIDFFPLRTKSVPLPAGWAFVAAHSMVKANKTGDRRLDYNLRPAECALAVALLNAAGAGEPIQLLGEMEMRPDALALVERHVPEGPVSYRELAERIGDSEALVRAAGILSEFDFDADRPLFQPGRRARHVLSEGRRVRETAAALERGDMVRVGSLLCASHESCAKDYGISTPELDALVGLCKSAGALGARLTGAGFGGFVVALVEESKCDALLERVESEYYEDYLKKNRPDLHATRKGNLLFRAHSTQGADRLTLPA